MVGGLLNAVEVNVSGKYEEAYGVEVVTETICFSKSIKNCIADVDNHDCPECGESNDLEVDLY